MNRMEREQMNSLLKIILHILNYLFFEQCFWDFVGLSSFDNYLLRSYCGALMVKAVVIISFRI